MIFLSQETFSEFLIRKRDNVPINNSQLAKKANITPVYLGEILKNKKSPPDKKTQYALAKALELEDEECFELFDLAAKERGEIPADVYEYLITHNEIISELRNRMKSDKL